MQYTNMYAWIVYEKFSTLLFIELLTINAFFFMKKFKVAVNAAH